MTQKQNTFGLSAQQLASLSEKQQKAIGMDEADRFVNQVQAAQAQAANGEAAPSPDQKPDPSRRWLLWGGVALAAVLAATVLIICLRRKK